MREKRRRVIVTFSTTTAAMAMEKLCMKSGVPGRLIPVPREITAGCGMAWAAPPESREFLLKVMEEHGLQWEGVTELTV